MLRCGLVIIILDRYAHNDWQVFVSVVQRVEATRDRTQLVNRDTAKAPVGPGSRQPSPIG